MVKRVGGNSPVKNAPQYVGEAKVAQRLSDFAFSSVFDFDFYVCTDFGIANSQSDEKTNMRKFVNSFVTMSLKFAIVILFAITAVLSVIYKLFRSGWMLIFLRYWML